MSERITAELFDRVLEMRINRPEKKNALTGGMYNALCEAWARADSDAAVRVITLTGSGDNFTSGHDIADFISRPASGGEQPVFRFLRLLSGAAKPVVAAVNGLAVHSAECFFGEQHEQVSMVGATS